jgi:hypothetical protein
MNIAKPFNPIRTSNERDAGKAMTLERSFNPIISFSGNFQRNYFNEIFQFLILLCSILCIPLSA